MQREVWIKKGQSDRKREAKQDTGEPANEEKVRDMRGLMKKKQVKRVSLSHELCLQVVKLIWTLHQCYSNTVN